MRNCKQTAHHSLGKGEADSSILSGSTSFPFQINGLAHRVLRLAFATRHRVAEHIVIQRRDVCKIRAVCSFDVPHRRR